MTTILSLMRILNGALEKLTAVTSSSLAAIMVLALTGSAVTRYVSGTGYDWFIELPPALVPWMVFPLLRPLLRSGSHIQVDLLPTLLEGQAALWLQLFVYSLMVLGSLIFLQAGNEAVALFRRLGQLMELEIELPIWWMYLAFPTGFFILLLLSFELWLETLRELITREGTAS